MNFIENQQYINNVDLSSLHERKGDILTIKKLVNGILWYFNETQGFESTCGCDSIFAGKLTPINPSYYEIY